MKALLATPLHTGAADREFIIGLLQAHGLYAAWTCLEGQANISRARDILAAQFLASDCTSLVFVDGDVGFSRQDLQCLLESPHPITGGLYQRKNGSGQWVCVPQPDDASASAERPNYRRVQRVGTGFLRIDRPVFEKLISGKHVLDYPLDNNRIHQFFPSGVLDGHFLSEDYFFCELAARAGFDIHIDTRIRLKHVGRFIYQQTP
ncbi:MAG TPA: hypothetical protein VNA21_09240 [Steroidobacteraceae bacterium]|nr:hypothetical protein [Steroidobacteraceae bacterium]